MKNLKILALGILSIPFIFTSCKKEEKQPKKEEKQEIVQEKPEKTEQRELYSTLSNRSESESYFVILKFQGGFKKVLEYNERFIFSIHYDENGNSILQIRDYNEPNRLYESIVDVEAFRVIEKEQQN